MSSVMEGEATPAQLGGLLLALRMRGETVDELTGFARAMRERVVPVSAPDGAIDTCGTGGDGSRTFNISTAAALVVAAAGVPVAKHGNRAMTSATGSADVLEALGDTDRPRAPIRPPRRWPRTASRSCSPRATTRPCATRVPSRRELGVPTAFNLLGPDDQSRRRASPGDRRGRPDRRCQGRARAAPLGTERAFVVHGDGVDELPLDGRAWSTTCRAAACAATRSIAPSLGLTSAPTLGPARRRRGGERGDHRKRARRRDGATA